MPRDLADHACVGYRKPNDTTFARPFANLCQTVRIQPNGSLTLDLGTLARAAVLDGVGIGYFPADEVRDDVSSGHLVRILADRQHPCPPHTAII